jgi:pimeloyl-ACP methyl ester carboxylesterase
MISSLDSPALRAYVREVFTEIDGEICERMTPDQAADLLLATYDHEAHVAAEALVVPTLLIACGQPTEQRPRRERAWSAFATASPLIELHVVEEWSHNPIFQDPGPFTALIAGWLDKHL